MRILPNRYNLGNLRNAISKPSLVQGELNRIFLNLNQFFGRPPRDGVSIIDEDWDNLLILDACRYDTFKEINWLDGELECRHSLGSCSSEFILNNFEGQILHDTIYVSANPFVSELSQDNFFDIIHLYETKWDEDLETVPPEAVTETVRDVRESYPNKRLIVHFMQPHTPFIGQHRTQIPHLEDNSTTETMDRSIGEERDIWTNLQYGLSSVDIDMVWKAYRENLEIVLHEVDSLLPDLQGKSVITADHGELFGERLRPFPVRGYGHPESIYISKLIEVPWLVIRDDERVNPVAENPVDADINEELVEERLSSLGYK